MLRIALIALMGMFANSCKMNLSQSSISTLDTPAVKAPVIVSSALGFALEGAPPGWICDPVTNKCYKDPNYVAPSAESKPSTNEPTKPVEATTPATPQGFEVDMNAQKWATGDGSQYLRPVKGNPNVYAYFDKENKQLPWLYDKQAGMLAGYKESPSEIFAENKFNYDKASTIYRIQDKQNGNYYGEQVTYSADKAQMESTPFSPTGLGYYYGNMQPIKNGDTTLVGNQGWGFLYQATPGALATSQYADKFKLGDNISGPVFFNPSQPGSYLLANQVNVNNMWVPRPVAQPLAPERQPGRNSQGQPPPGKLTTFNTPQSGQVSQGGKTKFLPWDGKTVPAGATILYATDWCGFCPPAKALAMQAGIYIERDEQKAAAAGVTSFPTWAGN